MAADSRLPQFRALNPSQRWDFVDDACGLSPEERALLAQPGALPVALADGMIENVIGTFELPLGVAGNFRVNGRDVLVPLAVEEPSIIAAASYMAKLAREDGGFQTSSTLPLMRAQVQVIGLSDPYGARLALFQARDEILALANSRDKVLIGLGGGCKDIEVHVFPSSPRGPRSRSSSPAAWRAPGRTSWWARWPVRSCRARAICGRARSWSVSTTLSTSGRSPARNVSRSVTPRSMKAISLALAVGPEHTVMGAIFDI